MIHRDLGLRGAALLVSLLLHGLLFLRLGSSAGNSETVTPPHSSTRVSFRAVSAPPTTPQPPREQDTPVATAEPEVVEAVEPPPPEPPPAKPPQRAERARQPAPAPAVEPSPPEATSAEAQKGPSAPAVAGTVADPALIEQARQEYLRRLMAHIEAHKHYPRAARRRGLEGEVRVAFTLLAGGAIEALTVDGGPTLLNQAAEEAMAAALPLPLAPEGMTLPWPLSFTMRFNLR